MQSQCRPSKSVQHGLNWRYKDRIWPIKTYINAPSKAILYVMILWNELQYFHTFQFIPKTIDNKDNMRFLGLGHTEHLLFKSHHPTIFYHHYFSVSHTHTLSSSQPSCNLAFIIRLIITDTVSLLTPPILANVLRMVQCLFCRLIIVYASIRAASHSFQATAREWCQCLTRWNWDETSILQVNKWCAVSTKEVSFKHVALWSRLVC